MNKSHIAWGPPLAGELFIYVLKTSHLARGTWTVRQLFMLRDCGARGTWHAGFSPADSRHVSLRSPAG